MKAAVLMGPSEIVYQEVPDPICPEDGIIMEIEACGICGSDLRTYEGGSSNKVYPSIIGHEFSGVIVESKNDTYKIGMALTVAPMIPCGECWFCKRGIQNLCENMREIGLATGIPGGFAELIALSGDVLKKGCINIIGEGVDHIHAVISETASSVLSAHENAELVMEDLVVIIGSGTIGLLHSEIAQLRGAKETMVVEMNPEKVELAKSQGFKGIYNYSSSSEELKALIMEKTEGRGADVVICACPAGQAQSDAIQLVRKRGKVIFFGGIAKGVYPPIDTNRIHYNEITIYGASAYTPMINKKAYELISTGRVHAEKYITHKYHLKDLAVAFKDMKDGKMIKGVTIPK
ncbi:MAG: alcohol dehydrogenase catalytic domain-containing protein [Eubacteriaceae bacterium]|nr:alcohol dehydrogenase catalytic domain-containing protein [Eubacteriaceae bacterium]